MHVNSNQIAAATEALILWDAIVDLLFHTDVEFDVITHLKHYVVNNRLAYNHYDGGCALCEEFDCNDYEPCPLFLAGAKCYSRTKGDVYGELSDYLFGTYTNDYAYDHVKVFNMARAVRNTIREGIEKWGDA